MFKTKYINASKETSTNIALDILEKDLKYKILKL